MAYKNIIVVGARGKLGDPLIRALLSSTEPRFRVTALARSSSTITAPPSATLDQNGPVPNQLDIVKVDFTRSEDLVHAFIGQDAAIFTMSSNNELATTSKLLIDAAVKAGVKRIIPSEFGTDESPLSAGLFNQKTLVRNHLETVAKENEISYTVLRTGPWFDITFNQGLGFDLASKTATIYNGGITKFHTTTLSSIVSTILRVVTEPAPFANKTLHVHDFFVSQQEILSVVEKVVGGSLSIVERNAEEEGGKALAALQRGEFTGENILMVIRGGVLGKVSSAGWDENDDSKELGLGNKSLEAEIRRLVKAGEARA